MDPLKQLSKTFPKCLHTIKYIAKLKRVIEKLPFEEFVEPISVIGYDGKCRTLHSFTDLHVMAWLQHVAGSARSRMGALEDAAFQELMHQNLLATMVLIRSHMEVAGLTALALNSIKDAYRSGKWNEVEKLLLSTLFGTSLRLEARKSANIEEMLSLAAQEPIRIGKMIEAIDLFATGDNTNRRRRANYALLCEYAHPSMGASKSFVKILAEHHEYGWRLQYKQREAVSDAEANMALKLLLDSMRIGYACSEILRRTQVLGRRSTDFQVFLLQKEEAKFIYTHILQRRQNSTPKRGRMSSLYRNVK